MAKTRILRAALGVLVALMASAALAETHFTLNLAAQTVDISGNQDMYLSQVNQKDGVFLQEFSLTSRAKAGEGFLFDSLRINGSGYGAAPYGHLSVVGERYGLYRAQFTATRALYYNALPSLANPFLGSGIIPGQHTLDAVSDSYDLDIEFLPDKAFSPILGLRKERWDGSQLTTYHVGEDEFLLRGDQAQDTQEIRAGFNFNVLGVAGSFMQGWRTFEITDSASLAPGAGSGNNSRPVLGTDISATAYARSTHTKGTTPITTFFFSGRLTPEIRLVGSYVRAGWVARTDEAESLSGSLASFDISRFFSGLTGTVNGRSDAPDWRGEARLETEVVDWLDFNVAYRRANRTLDGFALISDLYTGTVNFNGADPKSVSDAFKATTAMERNEKDIDATLSTRNLGALHLWMTWTKADESLTVTPDVAEIVVPGGQGGTFDRQVKRYSAGGDLTLGNLKFSADYKKDDPDQTIVRTDYTNLTRWRGRMSWQAGKVMRLVLTGDRITSANPDPAVGYSYTTNHYGGDLELTPFDALTLRTGYGVYRADSSASYRVPQDFTIATSLYREDGRMVDAGATVKAGAFNFDGVYSLFKNSGSLGFELKRRAFNVGLDVSKSVGVGLLGEWQEYNETAFQLSDFTSKRLGFFVRWQQ